MSSTSSLRLMVLADIHFASTNMEMPSASSKRLARLGCELAQRAITDARRRGGFDAVAILGDLLNNGSAAESEQSLATLAERITDAAGDAPLLIVPGNHDGDTGQLMRTFGSRTGLHSITSPGGAAYRFAIFADSYDQANRCTRCDEDMHALDDLADNAPLIALQHNPISPRIDSDYSYMHTNRDDIMTAYSRAGVLLSLSGHYHAGHELNRCDGVAYLTVPALCELPFSYAMITLNGREVEIESRTLALSKSADPPLRDSHCHTQFAYCATDVTAEDAIERSQMLNLAGVCFTEHAPQLYMSKEDFWAAKHFTQPDIWLEGPGRMAEFRRHMAALASGVVRVGLEVELDGLGRLTLRDEDRDWPDLLVGAVHWLAEDVSADLSDRELACAFMHANETLMGHGVDIIAHPWRFFRRSSRPTPKELYKPLVKLMAETNTAAEINFHTNDPDPAFIATVIDHGVKISFGSDSHAMCEAGGLTAHLALLREVAGTDDVSNLLY